MEQSECTESSDNPPVSSSNLSISEALSVLFLRNKKETAWFNNYVLRRWLVGYKSAISEKDRCIYLPINYMESSFSFDMWRKFDSKVRTLAEHHTCREQERIWKWVRNHETYTR